MTNLQVVKTLNSCYKILTENSRLILQLKQHDFKQTRRHPQSHDQSNRLQAQHDRGSGLSGHDPPKRELCHGERTG